MSTDAGGFAQILEVESASGDPAVAKCVRKERGAERELLIGDSTRAAKFRNVIPIIDSGEHEDFWAIIMPRAERSLAQYLAEDGDLLEISETIQILKDVATALAEINGTIVHRDLKPANILFHEGTWKLADFGIARYSDASTANSTRKSHYTPAYAAPEQWEHRHATGATDVYAFGILAYELLTGQPPFFGTYREDFRKQHLEMLPPELRAGPVKLRILVEECLNKDPEVRPHARALLNRLESAEATRLSASSSRLAEISQGHIRENARNQAALTVEHDRRTQFQKKVDDATRMLETVASTMEQEITDNVPTAVFQNYVGSAAPRFEVELGAATLRFERVQPIEHGDLSFKVIAASSLSVTFGRPGRDWVGRSHSLWFCDAHEPGQFGWYELAFMESTFNSARPPVEPFACSPYESEHALSHVIGTRQVAWPVTALDRADPEEFIDRWFGWFADAANGELRRPTTMPERPTQGTWR